MNVGKGGTGTVVSVARILLVDTIPLETPDTPVGPRAEVLFVNGKGGTLDPDSGAVPLCPTPLPDNEKAECEDTGRAVVDGKELV